MSMIALVKISNAKMDMFGVLRNVVVSETAPTNWEFVKKDGNGVLKNAVVLKLKDVVTQLNHVKKDGNGVLKNAVVLKLKDVVAQLNHVEKAGNGIKKNVVVLRCLVSVIIGKNAKKDTIGI
jgi:hypothetical protein